MDRRVTDAMIVPGRCCAEGLAAQHGVEGVVSVFGLDAVL